ncbi:hypothetical protein JEQ12_003035 [Ovis aries]|uniref:Uncharacterized protein n=1 Tax=Ovis aries TaxID=9940 RepID=A0A836AAF9_SHEEP|nr:hypothetical protein JEQ12_003035 [Ovis aries]
MNGCPMGSVPPPCISFCLAPMSTPCFPCGSAGKDSACNADLGSVPGLGRSPREGKGYPLQYSGLENSMDSIVHGPVKSWTQLSSFHFHRHPTALGQAGT